MFLYYNTGYMKIQRFFVDSPVVPGGRVVISDEGFVHQVRKVFRKNIGDRVGLLDNTGGGYEAEMIGISKDSIEFAISNASLPVATLDRNITLYVAIPKKDKFEWVVEKATELGVYRIIPIISDRTEKQNIKWDRVERIAREASEQSERGILPLIDELVPLNTITFPENTYVLHTIGEALPVSDISLGDVAVCIGPEGGWSDVDMEYFASQKVPSVRLGETILRAETASIAICARLLL